MQRANCTVKLSGQSDNTVLKSGVTPAEVAILIATHGEGSVVDIQPTGNDKTAHAAERSRLRTTYGHHVVDRLFPGEFNKLPVTFAELNIGKDEDAVEDDDAAAVAAEAARRAALTDEERAEEDKADQAREAAGSTGEDEDDKILRDRVNTAPSKQALRDIAKENDIDLSTTADKMEVLRTTLLAGLFPVKAG